MILGLALAVSLQAAPPLAAPDPRLTPGVVLSTSAQTVCVPGYAAGVRRVSVGLKQRVFAAYGLAYDPARYETDHLISLELGGSNDPKNLWPQPWPEARRKDVVETHLKRQVCAGRLSLKQAQRLVRDWAPVYRAFKQAQKKP